MYSDFPVSLFLVFAIPISFAGYAKFESVWSGCAVYLSISRHLRYRKKFLGLLARTVPVVLSKQLKDRSYHQTVFRT